MLSPWASWRSGVMVLTAVAGIALAAVGYNAPAMPSSIAIAAGGPAAAAGSGGPQPGAGSAGGAAAKGSGAATGSDPAAAGSSAGGAKAASGSASQSTAAGSGATSTAAAKTAGTSTATASTGSSTAPATGPLFSQSQYAPYSVQIYPGTPSSAAKQAMTGFQVSFKGLGGGKEQATITAAGQSQNASFIATDKLYFVETNLGDDGFGQDTNFGDDGFILTNKAGYITNK